jgi:hypothetical protein
MQQMPLSCWQCGTVLSAAGGRCPSCGAEQPAAPPGVGPHAVSGVAAPVGVVRPSRGVPREEDPEPTPRAKALPYVLLAVGLLAIGLVGVLLSPSRKHASAEAVSAAPAAPPVAPARPVDPNDLGIADPNAVDPMEVLGRAKSRALAWNRDAILVALRAGPVNRGHVSLTSGGTITYWFGKPTGEGFGPGAKVAGKRLQISVTSGPTKVDEVTSGPGSRAALEPNCPLDEAVRKAQAAGIPLETPVTVAYDMNDKHKKPVWHVSAGDEQSARMLDGWSCAILVR